MKLLQRTTLALFAAVLLAFTAMKLYYAFSVDRTPPVITCDSQVVEMRVGEGEKTLLRGVTASDDTDGDLTGQVMIKGVTQLITADTAKVTYIVFDSANNMATASRTVRYLDYEKPRFSLSKAMVYAKNEQVQLLDRLTASDVIDGDISGNIRVTTQNINAEQPGVYTVTVQVTNSLGDMESLPLQLVIRDDLSFFPRVSLSDYIVYLEAGDSFDPSDYIAYQLDPEKTQVRSQVDVNTPGVYQVEYTNQDYTVYLAVVVR